MDEQSRTIAQQEKSVYVEQGDVTIRYGEKTIPKNLTKPPFVSDFFLGRQDDITVVHQKLFHGSQLLLLVNGEGGIGKTTLAAHYYRSYQQDYQHMAWLFAEYSLLDALLTLALPLQLVFPNHLTDQQRLDGLLTTIAELKAPCLLIIDNANSLQDLENYYQALRSCPNFHIVLTTRITEFEQIASHQIGTLNPKDAIALFKHYYPKHQVVEDPLLHDMLVAVGYNTLVIELLAKNLALLNRLKTYYSLADLLNDLQTKGLLALNSQAVSSTYQSDGTALRKATPETIIAAMYDLSALNNAETALLSIFAMLPAEHIAFTHLETLLSEIENLDVTLLALAQKGWLDNQADSAFKISPVVQEITRKKNQVRLLQDSQYLIEQLIEKLDYEPGTGHFINASYEEAALFARYGENIVHYLFETEQSLAILCERLGNYHNTIGNLERALGYFDDDLELTKALYEDYPDNVGFKNGLAISYSKLGSTHTALGNLERALGYFEERSRLGKALYEDYPDNVAFKNGLAISYIQLGFFYEQAENKAKENEYYLLSKKLLTELVKQFPQYVDFKKNLDWVTRKLSDL